MSKTKHIPVLLKETVEGLHLAKGMTVVDATLGGGGHTLAMLERVRPARNDSQAKRCDSGRPEGRLIAFDTDQEAIDRFQDRLADVPYAREAFKEGTLLMLRSNFADLEERLTAIGVSSVDAILADLGFSSDQIESDARGLSFQKDGPLDMRLDRSETLTADEIVNTYAPEELEKIFHDYGEEPESRRITKAIVAARTEKPIATTRALADLIESAYPKRRRFRMSIHPATKTFQALRIAVNREEERLERFLPAAMRMLRSGGRLAVITFHSGEDRAVKRFFQEEARGCVCPPEFPVCRCGQSPRLKIITKRPIIPTKKEIEDNPRARSAKLRVAEKI